MDKLIPTFGCIKVKNKTVCNLKYKVLIHHSRATLNNDLHGSDPFVIVEQRKAKTALISKSNLDSISTKENSCAADETLIRTECRMKKVNKSYTL